MRVSHDMPVNLKSGACIGMAELPLNDFGRGSRVEQERSEPFEAQDKLKLRSSGYGADFCGLG